MIRDYKQNSLIETFGECGFIYEVRKANKKYFMYQLQEYGDAEKLNFKIIKKLISSHILSIVEEFEENQTTYIITDYAESNLLKLQISQPSRVFPLPVALDYFSKLIIALQQLHDCRLVYRNIRPQNIKIQQNDVYFSDFSLSQFCKRKQRLFDLVGLQSFMAPQFFGEDGYGSQVDIWAAGILLFYNLLGEYPFKFEGHGEESCMQQFKKKCQKQYNFAIQIQKFKNPGYIKSNKLLEDFFAKIFKLDYRKRITIKQIKNHKLFQGYFPEKLDNQMLEAIRQEQGQSSILMTQFLDLKKFKASRQIEKEQVILDFIQKSSESLMLQGAQFIPQNIRLKTQFAILKMALVRIQCLIDTFYGKRKPQFKTTQEQWEVVRYTSAFKKVCQSVEKRQRIIRMMFKSAKAQIPENEDDDWFSQKIPQNFQQIKIPYRNTISSMFEVCKTVMSKNKGNKIMMRKIIQIFSRIVILHLINRIFEDQDLQANFSSYFEWNKNRSLQNLDIWIHSEKQSILRQFIKNSTAKYL